jgi:hypothetical protein
MIHKHLLVPDRVRRPPAEGFSWVDRRFLRDFAAQLSGDAVFLYFFLAAVSDRQGLSFYNDSTLAVRLRVREEALVAARDELVVYDLVAYQAPLTQVLSLPRARVERAGPAAVQELLRTLAAEEQAAAARRNP